MKSLLILCLLCTAALARAQTTSPATPTVPESTAYSAEARWQEMQTILTTRMPEPRPKSQIEYTKWTESQMKRLQALGLEFFERNPTDPRRWQALSTILKRAPRYYADYRPEFQQAPVESNATIDEAAQSAWRDRVTDLLPIIAAAPDATDEVREIAAIIPLNRELRANPKLTLTEIQPRLLELAARFPNGDEVLNNTRYFVLRRYQKEDPVAVRGFLNALLSSPHQKLREHAEGLLRLEDGRKTPVELKFTALDGREVDLTKLRGKVVLIDFWATWCGPCVAEVPNLKKVYDEYRDQGFEIVGISLDGPSAKAKLAVFLNKHGMTWPQYYDGLAWKTPLAVQYSITGIPEILLLDKSGRLVSTNARGEALEREVKKYLALDSP